MKIGKRRVSTVTIALLCIVAILSTAFAYVWVTRTAQFAFTVKANGDFKIYTDIECITELTELWDFGELEADEQANVYYFYVKNEGNIPLNLTWNLTDGSEGWAFIEDIKFKFINTYGEVSCALVMKQTTPMEIEWKPLPYLEGVETTTLLLDHYEVKTVKLLLYVVPTAICEDISFQLEFYGDSETHIGV